MYSFVQRHSLFHTRENQLKEEDWLLVGALSILCSLKSTRRMNLFNNIRRLVVKHINIGSSRVWQ